MVRCSEVSTNVATRAIASYRSILRDIPVLVSADDLRFVASSQRPDTLPTQISPKASAIFVVSLCRKVLSAVGDLGVDGLRAPLLTGPLGASECVLVRREPPGILDLGARRECHALLGGRDQCQPAKRSGGSTRRRTGKIISLIFVRGFESRRLAVNVRGRLRKRRRPTRLPPVPVERSFGAMRASRRRNWRVIQRGAGQRKFFLWQPPGSQAQLLYSAGCGVRWTASALLTAAAIT